MMTRSPAWRRSDSEFQTICAKYCSMKITEDIRAMAAEKPLDLVYLRDPPAPVGVDS